MPKVFGETFQMAKYLYFAKTLVATLDHALSAPFPEATNAFRFQLLSRSTTLDMVERALDPLVSREKVRLACL